jgi:1,4-alpha-glucan branching enzyme
MTPIGYNNYELGVPYLETYQEIINTDRVVYGGSNVANYENIVASEGSLHNQPYRIKLNIAPFAAILLKVIKLEK